MAGKKTEMQPISIPKPDIRVMEVPIIGDARLVVHRWSEKARKEIMDKQAGKARKKKEPRDPKEEFNQARYVDVDEGWDGFPVTGIKSALVGACRYCEGITMVMARGVLHVEGEGVDKDGTELIRIHGDGPHMRTDMVRISMGTADIRYRPEFRSWRALVRVRYNANIITEEQLFNLFQLAGLHCGLGEGRPSAPKNTMDWGYFHPAPEEELEALHKEAA